MEAVTETYNGAKEFRMVKKRCEMLSPSILLTTTRNDRAIRLDEEHRQKLQRPPLRLKFVLSTSAADEFLSVFFERQKWTGCLDFAHRSVSSMAHRIGVLSACAIRGLTVSNADEMPD